MGPQQPGSHMRRESQASTHGDMAGHGGPPAGRGGFSHQGQGGGRGGRNYNGHYGNQPLGYSPGPRYSAPNGNRGNVPPYQAGRGGIPAFPNSPQPHRASPSQVHALPHHPGTPTMQQAVPMNSQPFYPASMYPQVNTPLLLPSNPHHHHHPLQQHHFHPHPPVTSQPPRRKKGARRDLEPVSHNPRPSDPCSSHMPAGGSGSQKSPHPRLRRSGGSHGASAAGYDPDGGGAPPPPQCLDGQTPYGYRAPSRRASSFSYFSLYGPSPTRAGPIDLSPESGQFEQLLTARKQQVAGPYHPQGMPMDFSRHHMMNGYGYPNPPMPPHYMPQPPPSSSPAFGAYATPQYAQAPPVAQAMSRNPSQVSERPAPSRRGPARARSSSGTPTATSWTSPA
ncbi:hypothetical protein VTK73DRAFT_3686 [Phialemonium thermophilum]|uniref:Uncharacterized protein n=1 Tax=Phialemonium thermophilum TaxID=223376 RepID=A0ABR3VFY5_9PEZI